MFLRTIAINKLMAMKARTKVIQGGTWAGKTHGIVAVIIDRATRRPNGRGTVVAETIPAVKEGALEAFENIMQTTGRWVDDRFNRNAQTYRFANGYRLQFKSFDTVGKAKAAGKRNDLFLNEANHIPFDVADTLMMRTTGDIWIDFNPDNEFWVHTETLKEKDTEFLLLKYTDNQACPESIKEKLEARREKAKTSKYWENWCRVYIDGEIGIVEGVVYPDWQIIDTIPPEARLLGTGIDFGYTNDPTAAVDLYKWNNAFIFDEVMYQLGMHNREIYAHLKGRGVTHVADSADPKSIAELQLYGLSVVGAVKGPDSVNHGIQVIQSNTIYITSRSVNMIREQRRYCWDKDRQGNATGQPIDNFNHCMDAARYIAVRHMNKGGRRRVLV